MAVYDLERPGAAFHSGTFNGFTTESVTDYQSAARGKRWLHRRLHLELLNRGVFMAPRGMCAVSTPMSANDVAHAVAGFGAVLEELAEGLGSGLTKL